MRDGPFVESVVRARERAMDEVPRLAVLAYLGFLLLVLGGTAGG